MRQEVMGRRRVTRAGMDHSVRRLPDITIPSAPTVRVACCGMVNDMLRLRSTRGKMSAEDGALIMNPQQAKKLGRHLKSRPRGGRDLRPRTRPACRRARQHHRSDRAGQDSRNPARRSCNGLLRCSG